MRHYMKNKVKAKGRRHVALVVIYLPRKFNSSTIKRERKKLFSIWLFIANVFSLSQRFSNLLMNIYYNQPEEAE
jgi:hypothetical protein